MPEQSAKRTAIVTGASRGIGRGIALALAASGSRVAINYNASADAAQAAADAVTEAGGAALIVQADVANADDRQRLLDETVERFGPVDLLVNNAGVAPHVRRDVLEMTADSYDRLMHINLRGPLLLTQIVARHMIEHRDHYSDAAPPAIVNISSISAEVASPSRAEYCISKAGMAMMTQVFAARLAEHNIGVFEIRPGLTATDMTTAVKDKYDDLIFNQHAVPIRRWGQPEDVGKAVRAIADNLLPYSTGQVINVDGGFHIKRL